MNRSKNGAGVAIIGYSGCFPGAVDAQDFWENILHGKETISFFDDHELISAGIDPSLIQNPNYVKAKGIIHQPEWFDADFFNYMPRDAKVMDPQHRLFMEHAWKAVEHSGHNIENYSGLVGVFGGSSNMGTYRQNVIAKNPGFSKAYNDYELMLANERDFLTSKVAYKFNLKGPALTIQTACSTSLVSVCMASQSLLAKQCDMAIAGGVSVSFPQKQGYLYREGMIFSFDGHCSPFDRNGSGVVSSNGVGIVVLKRLEDAQKDNNTIYAVIDGFATNNDGAEKIGYIAPSIDGQVNVIRRALAMSGFSPADFSYIETHGTATKLGDAVEIAALQKIFQEIESKDQCVLGAVKANIGHLDTAAGVAGLIKAILCFRHRVIPPHPNFQSPNPEIALEKTPFHINTQPLSWEPENFSSQCRVAGVNSFGVGGVNAHVILSEPPRDNRPLNESKKSRLFVFSAKTPSALEREMINIKRHVALNKDICLSDVEYTLQKGRKLFAHRQYVLARNRSEFLEKIDGVIKNGDHKVLASEDAELARLGQAWMKGKIADLELGNNSDREWVKRIALPTYPFEKKRFWVDEETKDRNAENNLLSVPRWKPIALEEDRPYFIGNQSVCLVFADAYGLGQKILEQIPYMKSVIVLPGDKFNKVDELCYEILPGCQGDYDRLMQEMVNLHININHALYCWSISDKKETHLERDFIQNEKNKHYVLVKYLKNALIHYLFGKKFKLLFIVNNVHRISGEERILPLHGMLVGLVKVISQEYPHLSPCVLDVDLPEISENIIQGAKNIAKLYFASEWHDLLGYRKGLFWRRKIEIISSEVRKYSPISIFHHGVYLVIGGLGHIGFSIAEYLAKNFQANLVLIGRTVLPPKDELKETIFDDETIAYKSKAIEKLRALGSKVLYISADVSNLSDMQSAIRRAIENYGVIHGVIHAAGITLEEFVKNKSLDQVTSLTSPKIDGTLVLDYLFRNMNLDFFVICSSLTTFFGGIGQAEYCSASYFQDAFCNDKWQQGSRNIVSLNWDIWEDDGMAQEKIERLVSLENNVKRMTNRLKSYAVQKLSIQEGIDGLLSVLLNLCAPQIMISHRMLQDYSNTNNDSDILDSSNKIEKEESKTNSIESIESLEKQLGKIIQEIFQIDAVTKTDNLYDLGLDSLLAVQIASQINRVLGLPISPNHLLDYPTLEDVIRYFVEHQQFQPKIITLQERDTSLSPLIFIHPGNGAITEYRLLVKYLEVDRSIYAIENSIFNDIFAVDTSIDSLVSQYAKLIRQNIKGGSYMLGGWSTGGVLAAETGRLLRDLGSRVDKVILLDAWANFENMRKSKEHVQKMFLNEDNVSLWFDLLWKRASRFFEHDINSINIPTVLYKASEPCGYYLDISREDNYFKQYVNESLIIEKVPGDHETMMTEPLIKALATKLMEHLSII